jgi:translation initiation factor IF-2
MAKKQLIQVVRELSVGMDTIHDFLVSKGFELEKKPNAKLSEDMYDALMIEYQNDLVIKNKAEQMSLSNRPSAKKEEKVETHTPTPQVEIPEAKKPEIRVEVVQPEVPESHVETTKEQEDGKVELKVVGKINLDDLKPKKKAPQPKPEVVEAEEAEKVTEKEVEKVETPPMVEEVAQRQCSCSFRFKRIRDCIRRSLKDASAG